VNRILGAALASCLMLPIVIAQASALHVDAGVLQTFLFEFEHEPPPPVTVDLTVEVWYMDGTSGHRLGTAQWSFSLLEGSHYRPAWSEDVTEGICHVAGQDNSGSKHEAPAEPYGFTPADGSAFGPIEADTTHVLCVQQSSNGEPQVMVVTDDVEHSPSEQSTDDELGAEEPPLAATTSTASDDEATVTDEDPEGSATTDESSGTETTSDDATDGEGAETSGDTADPDDATTQDGPDDGTGDDTTDPDDTTTTEDGSDDSSGDGTTDDQSGDVTSGDDGSSTDDGVSLGDG
jgi:hypothetical protein